MGMETPGPVQNKWMEALSAQMSFLEPILCFAKERNASVQVATTTSTTTMTTTTTSTTTEAATEPVRRLAASAEVDNIMIMV